MIDQIGCDRIYPDNNQGECPSPIRLDIDNPGECGQEEETDSAAEKRPARRPDPFHNRAYSGYMQQEGGCYEKQSRNQETLDWNLWSSRAEPFACTKPEEHRSERRDEAQSQITTVVECESGWTWKEIQKPDI